MTDLALPNDFAANTSAQAAGVQGNFTAIETFLNSTGAHKFQAGTILAAALVDGSVETAKLADLAVTTAKIADDAVTTAKIADDAVDEANLAEPNTWLRLATVASKKIAFGVGVVTGTGTSQASATITHGLGTTPALVIATADRTAGSATVGGLVATAMTLGATTFILGIRDVTGVNFSDAHNVYWAAIG